MVVVVLDKAEQQYAWPEEASLPEAAQFVTGTCPALAKLHNASLSCVTKRYLAENTTGG
jgi:hypothetical protein